LERQKAVWEDIRELSNNTGILSADDFEVIVLNWGIGNYGFAEISEYF
jgi:hypothetical protein